MDIEEKIKRLGLLLVSEQSKGLDEYYSRLEFTHVMKHYFRRQSQQFEFVVWRNGHPVFYSRKFLQETDVEEIEKFLETVYLR